MVIEQPYIGTWRPYVGTSPSRTPSLMTKNGLTVWNQLDYPYGMSINYISRLLERIVLVNVARRY